MRSDLGDTARLQHILLAIQEIEKYISGISFDEFNENSMMKFACIKQLEIIGEASNHLSDKVIDEAEHIDWGKIVGLRHILVHEYYGIDEVVVWRIMHNDLSLLKMEVEKILNVK
jgi:uncharacterized protein with HEPN domain